MKTLILACGVLAALIHLSCAESSDTSTPKSPPYTEKDFQTLDWLTQTWEMQSRRGVIVEEWTQEGELSWSGTSTLVTDSTEIVTETLTLKLDSGDIFYIPVVAHNDGAIDFKLASLSANTASFENLEHDFPNRIIYMLQGTDSLHVRIEGAHEHNQRHVDFHFRKR